MTVHVTHGHVQFDASAPEEFRDLVRETLETSDFITTEQMGRPDENKLLVQEVRDE